MFSIAEMHSRALIVSALLSFPIMGAVPADAAEKVLHTFQGGTDGALPSSSLIDDNSGNLFGTTSNGGGGTECEFSGGCGTIFELGNEGSEKIVHAFAGGCDGSYPLAGLTADTNGNYLGTTSAGGSCNTEGFGTIFKLGADGTENVLYAFQGGSDGEYPEANLVIDDQGNLFGTTPAGGNVKVSVCQSEGCGTVFKLAPNGSKVLLYAFQGGTDGTYPSGPLIADAAGNFYGTTSLGGGGTNCGSNIGCGTVYKVASDGTETVLHAFNGSDGAFPFGPLVLDANGKIYGATEGGGNCSNNNDCGVIFKLSANGSESVVYAFKGGTDGEAADAGLIMDKAGNLCGTTYVGGSTHCHRVGCGTVFKLTPDGPETILYAFTRAHGQNPAAALLLKNGLLYGTATAGGANSDGVVFSVKK